MDASLVPCIPVTDPPEPTCITVTVYQPDPGTIEASPSEVCPNAPVLIYVSGYDMSQDYENYIVIVDESGIVVEVVQGGSAQFTLGTCGSFIAYSYNYPDLVNNFPPVSGTYFTICEDGCCATDTTSFEIMDNIVPVLLNPPANSTLTCYDQLPVMSSLNWTDNCGAASETKTQSGQADLCNGGVLLRQWTYTDLCDNAASHVQMITITPPPLPAFIDPPADITVDCNAIPSSGGQLTATNTGSGQCAISAIVDPVQNGTTGICGGTFNYSWQYTDFCQRTITHVQNITVLPALMAAFQNLPVDTTIMCSDIPVSFPSLSYTNGMTGSCAITGSSAPIAVSNVTSCGGMITVTWIFTDSCNRTIEHTQFINVEPAAIATWINPQGDTMIACNMWPGLVTDLSYSNGLSGTCAIAGSVPGIQTFSDVCAGIATWEWQFTDVCGNTITHVQNVQTTPLPALAFIDPPADITLACTQAPIGNSVPTLLYTNSGSGACLFSGTVDGNQSGSWDLCGGSLERTWIVQDPCGNEYIHVQTITVSPAPQAMFQSPPADITIGCESVPANAPVLYVSNGITQGPCAQVDSVVAIVNGSYDVCGGDLTYNWEWAGACGDLLTHTQSVTVLPTPPPVFDAVTLPIAVTSDEIGMLPLTLAYSNGLAGSCAISGFVTATVTSNYNPCGGAASFQWNATDVCGKIITQLHEAYILPSPVFIDAGPDQLLDCATQEMTLTANSSHPGNTSWLDPIGGTFPGETITASVPGPYIAIISFADTCTFSDTVYVMSDPTLPSVSGGPDQLLNCEVRDVLLQGIVLISSGNVSYEWTDVNGEVIGTSDSIPVSVPGTYYVRIYDADADCWSEKDAVEVKDISSQPSAMIYADPGNILSCVIEYILMSSDKESNVQYTWRKGGQVYTDSVLQISEPGTVILIAFDTISLCRSVDSIIVNDLEEYPIIQIAPPLSLSCERTTVTLDASGSIPGAATGIYTWTNPAGDTFGLSMTLDVHEAGEYILTLVDPINDCISDDTVIVVDISVVPEILDAPDVLLGCDENGGLLTMSLAEPVPGADIRWQTTGGQIIGSSTGSEIVFSGTGVYVVEVLHIPSQCRDRDTIIVTQVMDVPEGITVESSPTSCQAAEDGTIILGMIQGGTPPYIIYVDGIEITETILNNLSAGSYFIEIEDAYHCILEKTIVVPYGDEVIVDLIPAVNVKEGDSVLLVATVNIPPEEIFSVQWTPMDSLSCDTCLSTYADPVDNMIYTVLVTDVFGCTGEATVRVNVAKETRIFIPNVISPGNNDNISDFLTVYSNNPQTRVLSLLVFDRWGELIFEKNDFDPNIQEIGWDGTFRGQLLSPGVFVYKVEVETQPGLVKVLTGDVTIVR